jgi:Uma2 family endonuclease
MAMNALTPVMTGLTWQEFLDLPEEYRHASLIDGELYVTRPAPPHQYVVRFGTGQETTLTSADHVLSSPLLPGFSVTLLDLVNRRSSRRRPR